jgi:hypothetical protein
MRNPLIVKAPRTGKREIQVFGHRDPRGPDNNLFVWVDEEDRLHIEVYKANRCYRFKELIEREGSVEIIAD